MSEIRQAAYLEAWDDIPTDALEFGINRAIRDCQHFPKPVEVREFTHEHRRKLPPGGVYTYAQLSETTACNPELAEESFKKVMAMFGDEWGLSTSRRQQRENI